MEININPQDIDLYVKNAILESTIGKNIKEALDKSLRDLFSGYRNPVQDIVKQELEKLVKNYLSQEHIKPQIMAAIAKTITPDAIESIVSYGCTKLREYYEDSN